MSPHPGGVVIKTITPNKRFKRDYKKLSPQLQSKVDDKLEQLLCAEQINGISFEKLKGYSNPDIYTIHVTGNYKISMLIECSEVKLRRVGTHNEIDRLP